MKDVVVVGGGLAGLSAAWRLRDTDVVLLESDTRVGGRIRSERRGAYWLNWGGHVFAGHDSSTDTLLTEVGVVAAEVPGSLKALSMNGRFLADGRVETYPFRVPMPLRSRVAVMTAGVKVGAAVARYANVVRKRAGETGNERQQRIYDFEGGRTFRQFVGALPEDADALFRTTVTRSTGEMDQISAGAGIGYFSLVWNVGAGLDRGIVGGPSTLTEGIAALLGDRVRTGSVVHEIVHRASSVVVRYRRDGADHEVEARTVVLATPATVAHRIAVDLPADQREALGKVVYGPHVSAAFLTDETSARRWDPVYAIAAPKRSFAIVLNQASIVRGGEQERQPGGSIMTFSPANLGRALLDKTTTRSSPPTWPTSSRCSAQASPTRSSRPAPPAGSTGRRTASRAAASSQPTLMRSGSRVILAGDYLGTLYTETAITTGFSAAREAVAC